MSTEEATRRIGPPSGDQRRLTRSHHRPELPAAGDSLFGFELRRELGRGAFACVFLAEQNDLARRPVVLKISKIEGDEPQTLAQLQHTHIVPIHSVHENEKLGLRAVCMPYFGGAALSAVLERVWQKPAPPTTGADFDEALAHVLAAPSAPSERRNYDYTQTCVCIVSKLAEALQHAHQRGVIHCDVKPSNVLIADDGTPMLLDFNVSQNSRADAADAVLGGTVAYMAPEHLQAILDYRAARTCDGARPGLRVDPRSDLYSLGVVLYEMLVGVRPFEESGSYSPLESQFLAMTKERAATHPSLHVKRPDLPWSLESIVRTCLHPDPTCRYQSGADLAEDLRRFLHDEPLQVAPELSVRERVGKWFRRHPRVRSTGTVAVIAGLLLIASGAALSRYRHHLHAAQSALDSEQAEKRLKAYEQGAVQALCYVNTASDLQPHTAQGQDLCEKTLAIFGVLERRDWQDQPDWRRLDAESRHRLAEETRELLLMLAWAKVRGQPANREVLRDALALLERADAIDGLPASRAVEEDRAKYLDMLGDKEGAEAGRARAEQIPTVTARDHYLLATGHARRGQYERAVEELNRALELNPRHYWAQLQRGICRQELGKMALAAGDFGACIGLWPDFAWGYFNRAYVFEKTGHHAEAIADYTAALQLDPQFALAYFNRGSVHLEHKEFARALADFQRACELGRDDGSVRLGIGVALEGLKHPTEADDALALALEKSKLQSEALQLRHQWVLGFAILDRLPAKAAAAFDAVLAREPRHPQALYGKAAHAVRFKNEKEALALFDQIIQLAPGFQAPRRFRATLAARRGDFAAASRDVNWCLEQTRERDQNLYAAACVASLAAQKSQDPAVSKHAVEQALAFLGKALEHAYAKYHFADDPDLAGIRGQPQFQAWLEKHR